MRTHFPVLFILLIGLSLFSLRCANRVAPAGGLEDKTSPVVLGTSPGPDSLHVPLDQVIEFRFSEWIRTDNIEKSVFISPTQPLVKVRAYGRTLKVIPKDPLKDSTTYVVVLGSDIQDMRSNKLAQSYTLSFSTGAFLDSGRISGRVCDESGRPFQAGVSLFAYLKQDTGTIDPMKNIPEYITQSGVDGSFVLRNLKHGSYRIFAVNDVSRNRRFNPDREVIGIPSADVVLNAKQPHQEGLSFFPSRQDTLPLTLDKVVPKPGGQLLVSFNKAVADSPGLDPAHYSISVIDSLLPQPQTLRVTAIYRMPTDSLTLLFLTDPMQARRKYKCTGIHLQAADKALLDTARDAVEFAGNPEADSVAPQLLYYNPAKYAAAVAETDSMALFFSEPVRKSELLDGFSLERLVITKTKGDSGAKADTATRPAAGRGLFRTPLRFVFLPDSPMVFGAVYRWRLRPEKLVDLAGNFSTDTMMKGSFSVIPEGEYGTLSGRVADSNAAEFRVLLLAKTGKKMVEVRPDKNGYYAMGNVPEGDYRLMAYRDANGNGRRDPGRLKPFAFAEPLVVAADSVHVRKRWDVERMDILPGK